jgi:hypothetical protein
MTAVTTSALAMLPGSRVPANHQTSEREAFMPRVKEGLLTGALAGGFFGTAFGTIAAALALGFRTEGLPQGVSRASQIPTAARQFAGWMLGATAVGIVTGGAIYGAFAGMRAANERFHL